MPLSVLDRTKIEQKIPSLGARIPLSALLQALAVAEHLNFRHAAKTLNIGQSSVSARIKALEEELGVMLFERHARGVRLTDAGRHFVEKVAVGIDQLEQAVKTATMRARSENGRLRVGVHALVAGSFLADLLGRFRKAHPSVAVEISEGVARETIPRLREGQLDLAFVTGVPQLSDCHSRYIWGERLLVALPATHELADRMKITWSDLRHETFLVWRDGTGPQMRDLIILRLAGGWPSPSIQRCDVGQVALLSMVGHEFGVTVVGESSTLLSTTGVVFLPIADELEPVRFSAVWSPYNQSPVLRNLLILARRMSAQRDSLGTLVVQTAASPSPMSPF